MTGVSAPTRSSHAGKSRRALLIHAGALGDFVLSLPIVQALHRSRFDAITILGRPAVAEIARGRFAIDEILDIDAGGFHRLFHPNALVTDHALRRFVARFDLIVDMLGATALIDGSNDDELPRIIQIDPRPADDRHGHITEQWLAGLADAGIDGGGGIPRLHVAPESRMRARTALHSARTDRRPSIILIHPGSGREAKCWPMDNFDRLTRELSSRGHGIRFLIGDVERARCAAADLDRLRKTAAVIEPADASELRDMLAAAECFVGNDCGVTHLAAAVGTPTLAIFGPTDPRLWQPLGEHVTVVRCSATSWPSVGAVLEAAERILRSLSEHSHDPRH